MKKKQVRKTLKLSLNSVFSSFVIIKLRVLISLAIIISCLNYLHAQPSGGPYGPIRQNYKLPKITGKIYYVAPDGKADSKGDLLSQPTTIENAIEKVKTGDAIVLRGGIYRTGNLTFNQGITMQPYADEQPVLKGTLEAKEWKQEGDSLWSTRWQYLFPATYETWWHKEREEKYTPLHRFNNDVVFFDGEFLQSTGSKEEVTEKTFYIDYNTKTIYVGKNPINHFVEITAFRKAIFRTIADCHGKKTDGIGPRIYGLEITQYPDTTVHIDGFYPQGISAEKDHGNDVKGTVIENCDISNCFRIGVFTIGDNFIMRNCRISNTSTEGLYIVASDDVLLEKNIYTKNNIENITGYYPSAVKIFNQSHRVTCRDNLVIDLPNSNGIWYDVGNVDGIFTNNWLENIGENFSKEKARYYYHMNGFFFEISKGAICAGNVFVNCGNGIMVLNSSNVLIYQNTLYNSSVSFGRNERSAQGDHFGWHPSTGPDVTERFGHVFVNNLLVGDRYYQRALMSTWQPQKLCELLKESQLKQMDNNVYVINPNSRFKTILMWSPVPNDTNCTVAIDSLTRMQKVFKGSSLHSKIISDKNVSIFKSAELGNFHLMPEFPVALSAAALPENIKKLIGLPIKYIPYIGAYPIK